MNSAQLISMYRVHQLDGHEYEQLDGHEFEQAPGVGDGKGSLTCCSPQGCKELDMTELTELIEKLKILFITFLFFQEVTVWDSPG